MEVSALIGLIAAAIGGGGLGSITTALVSARKNAHDYNNSARAQFGREFQLIVEQQNLNIERLNKEVARISSEVNAIRTEHDLAEDYIDLLLMGIANGTIPPIPVRNTKRGHGPTV